MSRMPFLSGGRLYEVEVTNPEDKSKIARFWGYAVNHFRATGDPSRLEPYEGQTYEGLLYDTDPDVIEDFLFDTDFDFQELYEP